MSVSFFQNKLNAISTIVLGVALLLVLTPAMAELCDTEHIKENNTCYDNYGYVAYFFPIPGIIWLMYCVWKEPEKGSQSYDNVEVKE